MNKPYWIPIATLVHEKYTDPPVEIIYACTIFKFKKNFEQIQNKIPFKSILLTFLIV